MPSSPMRADAPEFVPGSPLTLGSQVASAAAGSRGPTVGDVASRAVLIYGGSSLSDVVDSIVYAGHSAGLYIGAGGVAKGILTENDILVAYSDKVHPQNDASIWLKSGKARGPGFLLPMLTVEASMPLIDAATKLAAQRLTHFSCHHLVVEGGSSGNHQILSALDIMMALCSGDLGPDAAGKDATVASVMKSRGSVPEVCGSEPIKVAFDYLLSSEQNCALAVDAGSGFVYGVITPRDALRAYGEHIPEGTTVASWLRGVGASLEPRRMTATAPLVEAVQVMVANKLHHLLVVAPSAGNNVVGVISCLDIVCQIGELHLEAEALPTLIPGAAAEPAGKMAAKTPTQDSHPAFS